MNQLTNKIRMAVFIVIFGAISNLKAEHKPFDRDSLTINKETNLYQEQLDKQHADYEAPQLLKLKKSEAIALGIVVSSAWGAYYSKEKANHYFKKYEQSGPNQLESHMDKTKRYDRISETLLIISYVSTGYIIKRLLFD